MKTLTQIRVSKIPGFIKEPSYDFEDDGARFIGFVYKGLPLTQHRSSETTYLSFRVDYIASQKGFTYEDYSSTNWYKLCDKYNGVSELPVIEEIVKDLETVLAGIAELEKKVASEKIDTMLIIQRAGVELSILNKFTQSFESEFKFWKCKDKFELSRAYEYFNNLLKDIETVKGWYDSPESHKNLRYMSQRIAKYGYIEIKDETDNFYMKELTEMLKKQKAAA